jgi:hypothetical protein
MGDIVSTVYHNQTHLRSDILILPENVGVCGGSLKSNKSVERIVHLKATSLAFYEHAGHSFVENINP